MEILRIENLNFTYPESSNKALSGVNLSLEEGDFAVICGQSGSGKTTLLRLLKPELAPVGETSGEILFSGEKTELLDLRSSAELIGFVGQLPEQQIVTDTVSRELSFGLQNIGFDTEKIRRRVGEMAGYFGIDKWFDKKISELSGGQKQLLCLASVMAMGPKILLLDEPTSQLDPIAASDFIATLKKLNRDMGLTVILSEHRLEDVFLAADKVFIMDGGKISASGTPRSVSEALASFEGGHRMEYALPSALRIFRRTGGKGEPPLTVREGREYIRNNFKNNIKSINKTEQNTYGNIAVNIKNVYFKYERELPFVISGCREKIYEGEIFSVLGGNGSGKTTLLSLISGLVKPYGGKIEIFGKSTDKYRKNELYRELVSMLPQNPQDVFIGESVRQDFDEINRVMGRTKEEGDEKILSLCSTLEITELIDRHPYDLSGGEQQRCALAKVLLTEPKLLLLDEPTRSIDAYCKNILEKIIKDLKRRGVTVIIVTHDVEFSAVISDRCALFFDGELTSVGEPEEFFSGNDFYTTQASRISRGYYDFAVTCEQVSELCDRNGVK